MSDRSSASAADDLYNAAMAAHAAGRHGEAVRLLGQASAQGHVAAMSVLGGQLLSGRGAQPDPQAGARLILRAAEAGGGYACGLAASLVAAGLLGPPDWSQALDYLQRAAELGHQGAQDQLRVLADRPMASGAERGAWGRLRRNIDLAKWRAAPAARPLSVDPVIKAVDGFVSPAACDWIIARAQGRLEPAQVFDPGAVRPIQNDTRTNSAAPFDLLNADLVILLVRERLASASGHAARDMEAPQVFHYAVGQQFSPHFDFLETDVPGYAEALAVHGQRVATLLVYLNDDFEGGQTDFPLLGLRIRGGKGDALMFANTDAQGQGDRRMLHAGLAPTSGEKWLLSQWVRDRAGPRLDRV